MAPAGLTNRVSVLMAERALTLGSVALFYVLAARVFTTGQFATAVFASGVAALLTPITDAGQTTLIKKVLASADGAASAKWVKTAMLVSLMLSIPCAVLALVLAIFAPPNLEGASSAVLVATAVLVARPLHVLDYVYQAKSLTSMAASLRIVATVGAMVPRVVALTVVADPHAAVLLFLSGSAFEAFIAGFLYIYRSDLRYEMRARGRHAVGPYFREISPLLVITGAGVIYMRVDGIMLAFLSSATEVAVYGAAVRLVEIFLFVPVVLGQVLGPRLLANSKMADTSTAGDFYLAVSSMISIIIVVVVILTAPQISRAALGAEFAYADVSDVVRIYALSLPFVFFGVWQMYISAVERTNHLASFRAVAAGVVSVFLNLLLMPTWGATAAAWVTVFTYMMSSTGFSLLSAKTRGAAFRQIRSLNPIWIIHKLNTRE